MKPYYQDDYATIYHGDCRDVLRELVDADLILTSPPYADVKEYEGNFNVSTEEYPKWLLERVAEMYLRLRKAGSLVMVIDDCFRSGFLDPYVFKSVLAILEGTPLRLAQRHYWLKPNARPDNTHRLKNCIENIFHFAVNGYYSNKDAVRVEHMYAATDKRHWKYHADGADPSNVIVEKKSQDQATVHPALYPTEIPQRFIKYLCPPGGTVLDPFNGSGTTLRAAKDLGRKSIGIEIEEKYCEIAAKRLAQEVLPFAMPVPKVEETAVESGLLFQ